MVDHLDDSVSQIQNVIQGLDKRISLNMRLMGTMMMPPEQISSASNNNNLVGMTNKTAFGKVDHLKIIENEADMESLSLNGMTERENENDLRKNA